MLESVIDQPRDTSDKADLYPDAVSETELLYFALVMNHAFVLQMSTVGHLLSMKPYLLN